MTTEKNAPAGAGFLDMQAHVGITKHMGGFEATDELLALCHVEEAREVLYVGCGIGVGSAYIARKYGCQVVGVDISEKMIEWSRKRAREEHVEDKTEFRVADVLDLPFEADRFDVVFVESVLVFVADKPRAIRECVRVTRSPEPAEGRPGGYVGLNEAYWTQEPTPEMVAQIKGAVGTAVPTIETWQSLWEASGLQDRVVRMHPVESRKEIRDRLRWVGWRWILKAWGRSLRLYITNPAVRQSIKGMFDAPAEAMQLIGYGLFVGRK
jgi:SAM-dependent methyltransferase